MSDFEIRAELKTLQLNETFRIAHGNSDQRQVLRLYCGNAVGEAPFVPYYGEDPAKTLDWARALKWNPEVACSDGPKAGQLAWDLLRHDYLSRQNSKSLAAYLGLPSKTKISGCRSLSIPQDLNEFSRKIKERLKTFHVLKLKLGSGDLSFDEAIVAKARETAPHATIFADVNGGWSLEDSITIIPRLEKFKLLLIEQPLHHNLGVAAWKELKATLPKNPIPLFADESIQGPEDVHNFRGLVEGVNVKLLKCGTLQNTIASIQKAREYKMGVLLGCMIESIVGTTAAAHLAGLVDWIDLDGHLYVANNEASGITYDTQGKLCMPEALGIGVDFF